MDSWWNYFWGSTILVLMAAVVGVVVFLIARGPTKRLLNMNSQLAKTAPFYIRMLFVLLILGAIFPVIGNSLSTHGQPMEYFWEAAGELSGTVLAVGLYLFGFLIMMTILATTLGRHRDE